ncbi:hypothetical protein RCO48_07370 [Peribacillus frigoritolerans]|nr:hypothetical protein [Peribacillus frigoritolerans]
MNLTGNSRGFNKGFDKDFDKGIDKGIEKDFRAGQQAGFFPGPRQMPSWPNEIDIKVGTPEWSGMVWQGCFTTKWFDFSSLN